MPAFDEQEQEKRLAELRRREEEELIRILSKKYRLSYADLSQRSISTDALRLVDEEKARAAEVAAFEILGKKLTLAIRTPNTDATRRVIQKLEDRGYQVTPVMVSSQSLERAWSFYADLSFSVETRAGVLDISGDEIQKLLEEMDTLKKARAKIEETLHLKRSHRISRILEIVLSGGLANRASDVHVEPEEADVRLRFRLDGVLTDIIVFDRDTYSLLLSRIKLLSGLKLNIKDRAQDGRFSVRVDTRDVEIRTSILPGAHGESIVLRLLDPGSLSLPMEELGIEPKLLNILEKEMYRPNGMILTTGPTGSGKTTMLYAFLKRRHTPDIKIITIEDPIEYRLEGIVQTQVKDDAYSFGGGLRAALRQDPDVIMIGEIRDREVAETAINASLTGHLVFSTLHTNTAAGAFPRLVDLGVNTSVIGPALRVVIAQRLVRRLRTKCAREVPLEGEHKELVGRVLDSMEDKSLIPEKTDTVWEVVENAGCEIPYRGRIGIFEAILMDSGIEELVERSAGERDIAEAARRQGIPTMLQDGILKVLRGITTLSELSRVIDVYGTGEPIPEDVSEEA